VLHMTGCFLWVLYCGTVQGQFFTFDLPPSAMWLGLGFPTHTSYFQNTYQKLHQTEISDKPAVSTSRADDADRRENLKSHKTGNCRQILLNSLTLNFIQIRPSILGMLHKNMRTLIGVYFFCNF
jgi:hypothetical protein